MCLPGGDARSGRSIGMAAVMGGTMRSPLTGVLFALELTRKLPRPVPLLIASAVAHAFTVLVMKRSILTEKVARRGYHVSREYAVDPLERLSLSEVMTSMPVTIPAGLPLREVVTRYFSPARSGRHQGYPVVNEEGTLLGMVTRSNLLEGWVAVGDSAPPEPIVAYDLIAGEPIVAFPGESCRSAAERRCGRRRGPAPGGVARGSEKTGWHRDPQRPSQAAHSRSGGGIEARTPVVPPAVSGPAPA